MQSVLISVAPLCFFIYFIYSLLTYDEKVERDRTAKYFAKHHQRPRPW